MADQPSSSVDVRVPCRHTLVLASGSTKRCLPRDLTNVRDLCASTATLRSDDVLPAFFLECLWLCFFWLSVASSCPSVSTSFWVKSTLFRGVKVDEKGRAAMSDRNRRRGRLLYVHRGARRALAKPLRVFGRKEIIASIMRHDHDFVNFSTSREKLEVSGEHAAQAPALLAPKRHSSMGRPHFTTQPTAAPCRALSNTPQPMPPVKHGCGRDRS
jgi:hypothetical protein